MTKKNWIVLGIAVVVIIAILALIKLMPFYATIVALVAYAAGILSLYIYDKAAEDGKVPSLPTANGKES